MLRIAPPPGMPPQAQTPMPQPEDPANAAPGIPGQDPMGQDSSTDMDDDEVGLPKLDPQATGYMGSDQGPFECEHCLYFEQPNACHIVSGDIDPHGCCNLYVKNPASSETDEPQGDDQAAPLAETDEAQPA